MIDLHVHLLPGWDDGPATVGEAKAMAEIARDEGITKVVAAPHIFNRPGARREGESLPERIRAFIGAAGSLPVEVVWAAEVFVHPNILENLRRHTLTINASDYFFIEFAADTLPPGLTDFLYGLMLQKLIPVICHPERNAVFQARPHLLYDLVKMGCLSQITAAGLVGGFGPKPKAAAEAFLKNRLAHVIASDAHDTRDRPPRLRAAVERAAKLIGREAAEAMVTAIPQAILDNREIGVWGEPENPERPRKTFMIRLPWQKTAKLER